jgi:sec-independent protein translocase protein TatA
MGLDNPIHIAFLLILLLLVFGAKRLPEMGRSLGSGMRGFKDSLSGENAQPAATPQPQPQPQPAVTTAAASAPAPVLAAAAEPARAPVEEPAESIVA